jgi:hypothetical protein
MNGRVESGKVTQRNNSQLDKRRLKEEISLVNLRLFQMKIETERVEKLGEHLKKWPQTSSVT